MREKRRGLARRASRPRRRRSTAVLFPLKHLRVAPIAPSPPLPSRRQRHLEVSRHGCGLILHLTGQTGCSDVSNAPCAWRKVIGAVLFPLTRAGGVRNRLRRPAPINAVAIGGWRTTAKQHRRQSRWRRSAAAFALRSDHALKGRLCVDWPDRRSSPPLVDLCFRVSENRRKPLESEASTAAVSLSSLTSSSRLAERVTQFGPPFLRIPLIGRRAWVGLMNFVISVE